MLLSAELSKSLHSLTIWCEFCDSSLKYDSPSTTQITPHLDKYPNADILWCQEEPLNNGAWTYVGPRILTAANETEHHKGKYPLYAGRDPTSSVATGSKVCCIRLNLTSAFSPRCFLEIAQETDREFPRGCLRKLKRFALRCCHFFVDTISRCCSSINQGNNARYFYVNQMDNRCMAD
jgi:hypothetical protein